MRLCVLDCSFAMAWVFEDEKTAAADALLVRLRSQDSVVVPAVLWNLEVRNVLRNGVKGNRITAEHAEERRLALEALPRVAVPCPHGLGDGLNALMLAHDLTSYDACYLAIAIDLQMPLATKDKQLLAAARRSGVPLFQEVAQ